MESLDVDSFTVGSSSLIVSLNNFPSDEDPTVKLKKHLDFP